MWTARVSAALVAQLLGGATIHVITSVGILIIGRDDEGGYDLEFIPEGEIGVRLMPTGRKPSQRAE